MKMKNAFASSLLIVAVTLGTAQYSHAFTLDLPNIPSSSENHIQLINNPSRKTVPEKYQRKVVRLHTNEAPVQLLLIPITSFSTS